MTAAKAAARPGRLVRRSAVAAGPMSSAVDRIAPIVTADSDTATASAARYPMPTRRTRTPCAVARSELIELRISGRYIASTMPEATTLKTAMTGTIDDGSVKIDPKRTLIVAPVVLDAVESRYRNRAASPSD